MEELGITSQEAQNLKVKFGNNILPHKEVNTWYKILFSQFTSPLVLLLVVIAIISIYFKESLDAALIALVCSINVLTGFIQEFSAQRTLSALQKIIKTKCIAVRDGHRVEIETIDLVPGDVVVVSSGDKIPADGKIVKGQNILINEAILTGEEEAVVKSENESEAKVFMGTTIVSGQGLMLVEKIGLETKIGGIGKSLSEIEEETTPLQKRLEKLTKALITAVIVICAIIFGLGILRGGEIWETFRVAVILSIAALPEGLPIAITVILAIGVRRILKRKGLVKRLLSIETLGSTSVICLDKTGTLTEGVMQVVKTDFNNEKEALLGLTLLNDRKVAMEVALWKYLGEQDHHEPEDVFRKYERLFEEPFDSAKKYKSVVNMINGHEMTFLMGAPEILIEFCKMDQKEKTKLKGQFKEWAEEGLRILGVAERSGSGKEKKDFNWLGLVGIKDPIRKEAKSSLLEAAKAGIEIKIVTGDYEPTAVSVAKGIGMDIGKDNVMNAEELDKISDAELSEKIGSIKVFARVTPLQKLRIVKVLQEKGETVAMTGDGVNDAPALKKANIGIVVENGTDVAKEAADLILLDSNFQTIVQACEEGRLIFYNIKKVVGYTLSNSFAEIVLIFGSLLLNLPVPLLITQILWIHLICDGPPDIMLGFEGEEEDLLELRPSDIKKDSILSLGMRILIFTVSLTIGLVGLGVFYHYVQTHGDLSLARTIIFELFASISLIYIFSFKNLKKFIYKPTVIFNNKYLNLSVLYGFVLVFAASYVPFLNKVLGTTPLSLVHWLEIFGVCLFVTLIIEISKVTLIKNKN